MTTFQDPPPQSRRAVRQSERGESVDAQGEAFVHPAQPKQPQVYSDPAAPQNMWDTVARRAAQLAASAEQRGDSPAPSGRRSSGAPVEPAGEPLTYSTQGRGQVPSYDGPFRNRREQPAAETSLPPTQALPRADQPSYRMRDYSPESRRAAGASAPSWNTPQAPATPSDELNHQTQAKIAEPVAEPVAVPPQAKTSEHTLTRRELRALRAQAEAAAAAPELQLPQAEVPEVVDTILHSGPIELPLLAPQPEPSDALAGAMAEFDALTRGSQLAEPPAATRLPTAAQPIVPQKAPAFERVEPQAALPALVEPPALIEPGAPAANLEAPAVAADVAAEPVTAEPATGEPVAVEPAAPEPIAPVPSERPTWSPPAGHWSTQADRDDEGESLENTINRTIGSGSATTNALVLPVIPMPSDISGALTSTGEVMLTGSIDLPRSLGSTGASSRIDDDGIDSLFELNDHELTSTDSQPVRAIRAVSTHNTGSHGVTHTQKPKGTRMLTALIVSAVVMAVVAVGLLITAMTSGVL